MFTLLTIKRITAFISVLFVHVLAYGQLQDKNWYFGNGTDGLIFNGGVPTKVSDKYNGVGFEGIIVVNDPVTGNLLFYSDGIRVINSSHTIMQNGSGLTGNSSGAQAVQCCPVPGSCPRQYYLFTNSAYDLTQGSISYSIIDFSTNPSGSVIQKNTALWAGPSDQGMCLVNKPGTNDYWLIANTFYTTTYNVFAITKTGISSPVAYNFTVAGSSYQMNYSEAAKKIVVTGFSGKRVTTINFDATTGILSNEVALNPPWNGDCYGARFSPDGTKLYVGVNPPSVNLVQYDYSNGVWTQMNTCCYAHDLKMGPDGKMYHLHEHFGAQPMAVIDFPDKSAVNNACGYRTITFTPAFNGEVRRFPEFVTLPKPSVANWDLVTLTGDISYTVDVLMNDVRAQGDSLVIDAIVSQPQSGTVAIVGSRIVYTRASCVGEDEFIYRIRDGNCSFDTARVVIKGNSQMKAPAITASPVVCLNDTIRLTTPAITGATYHWTGPNGFASNVQNPIIAPASLANQGIYKLSIMMSNCSSDTAHVIVSIITGLPLTAGPDQDVCEGSTVTLSGVSIAGVLYKWTGPAGFTASTPVPEIKNIKVSQSGTYTVVATTLGCTSAPASTVVTVIPKPVVTIGPDIGVCKGKPLSIVPSNIPSAVYSWRGPGGFNSSQQNILIDPVDFTDSGEYVLFVTVDKCKSDTVSVRVSVSTAPMVDLGIDKKICNDVWIGLDAGNEGSAFLWDDLSTQRHRAVKAPGTFFVAVTNGGCTTSDTVVLDTFPTPHVFIGNDTNICSNSSIILEPGQGTYASYTWQDQSTNRQYDAKPGTYWLLVKDQNACEAIDTIEIGSIPVTEIDMPSLIRICDRDTLIGPTKKFLFYTWQDGSDEPTFLVTEYGTYTLVTEDSNFCSDVATVQVLSGCPGVIYMPSAFSPNRDGINDLCYPVVNHLTSLRFVIYNRWGQRVFDTDKMNHGWDGTIKGVDAQSDTYTYSIDAVDIQQKTHKLQGSVTLLR